MLPAEFLFPPTFNCATLSKFRTKLSVNNNNNCKTDYLLENIIWCIKFNIQLKLSKIYKNVYEILHVASIHVQKQLADDVTTLALESDRGRRKVINTQCAVRVASDKGGVVVLAVVELLIVHYQLLLTLTFVVHVPTGFHIPIHLQPTITRASMIYISYVVKSSQ